MDKQHQIKNIIEVIMIPINDIELRGDQVELFYDRVSIGYLRILKATLERTTILKYQADSNSLNQLNWKYVFERNKEELTLLVHNEVKDSTLKVSAGSYLRLHGLEPESKIPLLFGCAFDSKTGWRVFPTMI